MFDKLRKILPDLSKAKIIEGVIDPETHIEYIEYSSKIHKKIDTEEIKDQSDDIFKQDTSIEEKKRLLVSMAKIDDVNIYRKLQKYSENPDKDLNDWAFIALQESLSLIKSSLLGEDQILISTGLGGKNNKLRFFIIAQTENNEQITKIKQKIIKQEVEFAFKNNNCELEKIEFGYNFFTIVALFPFEFEIIENTLTLIVDEVKNFNINLSDKYIITNVKTSTLKESEKLLNEIEKKAKSNNIEKSDFEEDDFEDEDQIDGLDDFDDNQIDDFDDDQNEDTDEFDDDQIDEFFDNIYDDNIDDIIDFDNDDLDDYEDDDDNYKDDDHDDDEDDDDDDVF